MYLGPRPSENERPLSTTERQNTNCECSFDLNVPTLPVDGLDPRKGERLAGGCLLFRLLPDSCTDVQLKLG